MKIFALAAFLLLLSFFPASANFDAHEYAPLVEKDISYENWNYKNIETNQKVDLREFSKGKKLVMVVYFAPWCHTSNYQAPVVQKLYDKYKENGFAVIGVSLYGAVAKVKDMRDRLNLGFPIVTESTSSKDRDNTLHYKYRTSVGDTRKWGTPWNIFLVPGEFSTEGDVLVNKATIVNGEIREQEAEYFIRKKLRLPPETPSGDK